MGPFTAVNMHKTTPVIIMQEQMREADLRMSETSLVNCKLQTVWYDQKLQNSHWMDFVVTPLCHQL